MRLAMVVEKERFETMRSTGGLLPDSRRIMDESFRPAYEWMAARMTERLPPPQGEAWPLWAWAWYDGFDVSPPHERVDTHLVLEIAKDPREVLLSEFHSWHHALNNWYLPDERVVDQGEAEMDAFYKDLETRGLEGWSARYPDDVQARVEESWERTFDVRDHDEVVQAVFFSLAIEEVVAVRPWDRPGARRRRVTPHIPEDVGNLVVPALSGVGR